MLWVIGLSFTTSGFDAGLVSAVELRVMTFNIRYGTAKDGEDSWDRRKEMVYEMLREDGSELIGLQEVLDFQLDKLQRALPKFKYVGVGRDGGKKGEYSAIMYRADRFELIKSETAWLSATPDRPSVSYGNQLKRIVTWAKFRCNESKRLFYVFNSHFDHRSAESRLRSAEQVLGMISRREGKHPVIVTGDFNCAENSPPMQLLLNDATPAALGDGLPLRDSFRVVHPDEDEVGTFHGFTGKAKSKAKIDAVLVGPEFEVKGAEIIRFHRAQRYPSDHFPVIAVLEFAVR